MCHADRRSAMATIVLAAEVDDEFSNVPDRLQVFHATAGTNLMQIVKSLLVTHVV